MTIEIDKKKVWDKKDQAIFECADKGLLGLKRFGWLTLSEYEEIDKFIHIAIEEKKDIKE